MDTITQLEREILETESQISKLENEIRTLKNSRKDNVGEKPHRQYNNHHRSRADQVNRKKIPLVDIKIDAIAKICDEKRINRANTPYLKNSLIALLNRHGIYEI